ncbi:SUMF1/EgtB/PvdO family nonheme iron enzyme [Rhodoferax sp. WC2427]|uniref:SUMF1/EgtB/PvdO family nonheme iron enzyme n=1 Tax=Rhodoferax sp. WC2427 TaxID=3234144 RepID=UPI00346681B6
MRKVFKVSVMAFTFLIFGTTHAAEFKFKSEFVKIVPEKIKDKSHTNCTFPTDPYEISKYELSNTEYVEFLNSVAKKGDPFNLYTKIQSQHFWGGIIAKKVGEETIFYVKYGYEKLPATFISWFDAIRYLNWLSYGKPNTGRSELGTTEGNATHGAYNTADLETNKVPPQRNKNATYFLPTCGEWIYAGFYNPINKIISRDSGGDTPPIAGPPNANTRSANYYTDQWAIPYPHLAAVDAYTSNSSALGTLNQAGNVMEWVETDGNMALGGSLFLPGDTITSTYRDLELPSKKLSSFGFRIAKKTPSNDSATLSATAETSEPFVKSVSAAQTTNKTVPIEKWIRISIPGNTSDFQTGRGCVANEYEIAAFKITNQEYSDFLNSVAASRDTYFLYLDDMSTGIAGGIERKKTLETYRYSSKNGYENRPVAYLSWFMIARYANWMHFGKPVGDQVLGVTEGNSSTGAYDTTALNAYKNNKSIKHLLTRNPDAKYFIPNDDEWYKAAYYDPEKSGLSKYWIYPERVDAIPENSMESKNGANFQNETMGEGAPYYVSESGVFKGSGYFKVSDMGGNLWEWTETWRNFGGEDCWRCDTPKKGLRGGSFNYIEIGLDKKNIDPGIPDNHYFTYGGRLARRVESSATSWCIPADVRYRAANTAGAAFAHKKEGAAGLGIIGACGVLLLFWRRRRSQEQRAKPKL